MKALIREWIELSSRRVVLYRRYRPEYGGGRIYVTPESGLRYWKRDLNSVEPELLELARIYVEPGDVVWDIGANVGIFAFASAGLAGPLGEVYAFEPDVRLVELLRRSAKAQPTNCAKVTVVPTAVSETTGFATFQIAKRSRASNSLARFSRSTSGGHANNRRFLYLR